MLPYDCNVGYKCLFQCYHMTCNLGYKCLFQCHSNETLSSVRTKISNRLKKASETIQIIVNEKMVWVFTFFLLNNKLNLKKILFKVIQMCGQINIMYIFPWIDVSYCQHQTSIYVTWVLPNFFFMIYWLLTKF